MKVKNHTKTFNAYSDDDRRYTIYEYTEFENVGSFDNPNKNGVSPVLNISNASMRSSIKPK